MNEILEKLAIEPKVLLFMIINFVTLLIILKVLLFKPVAKIIKERQDKIEDGLKNAKEMEEKLDQFEKDYKKKLEETNTQVKSIIADAKEQSKKLKSDAKEQANEDSKKIIESSKKEIDKMKDELKKSLKKEMGEIITESVQDFIKTELTEEQHKALIQNAIKELES